MIVEYTGKTEFLYFTHGKQYKVLAIEYGCYRIVDDSGEDYLYSRHNFRVVDDNMDDVKIIHPEQDDSDMLYGWMSEMKKLEPKNTLKKAVKKGLIS